MAEQAALQVQNRSSEYALARLNPAVLGEVLRDNLGAGGLDAKDLDRIKIPAGGGLSWNVPSLAGELEEREITGVIIHWADRRAYWAEEFSGEGRPPDCYSEDTLTGIGKPGGACERCPLAQFGSSPKGGGQACKQIRQLFVARQGGGLLPVVIALPPTSIQPIRKYFLRLASEELACWAVVTKLTLEKTKNATGIQYSRVVASMVDRLDADMRKSVEQYRNQIRPVLDRVSVTDADYSVPGDGN